jgi:hypothetical protein
MERWRLPVIDQRLFDALHSGLRELAYRSPVGHVVFSAGGQHKEPTSPLYGKRRQNAVKNEKLV